MSSDKGQSLKETADMMKVHEVSGHTLREVEILVEPMEKAAAHKLHASNAVTASTDLEETLENVELMKGLKNTCQEVFTQSDTLQNQNTSSPTPGSSTAREQEED